MIHLLLSLSQLRPLYKPSITPSQYHYPTPPSSSHPESHHSTPPLPSPRKSQSSSASRSLFEQLSELEAPRPRHHGTPAPPLASRRRQCRQRRWRAAVAVAAVRAAPRSHAGAHGLLPARHGPVGRRPPRHAVKPRAKASAVVDVAGGDLLQRPAARGGEQQRGRAAHDYDACSASASLPCTTAATSIPPAVSSVSAALSCASAGLDLPPASLPIPEMQYWAGPAAMSMAWPDLPTPNGAFP
ncbi:hypothetical protein EJB05_57632, partial [Eragrostis curvula]